MELAVVTAEPHVGYPGGMAAGQKGTYDNKWTSLPETELSDGDGAVR